jgi:hypothetical protein
MTAKLTLTLLFLLAPLLARADTLEVYGSLTGKTVLMPTTLPRLPDAIVADLPTDKTNAIARIEKALSEQGLEVVQDGPHFVRVFPKEARDSLTNSPLRGAELALRSDSLGFGSGGIDFKQADLNQVLSIYASISQRTVLRPITLPAPTVNLKTQCPLTREEAIYAFATVLALNGVCVVDDGPKFVQVAPMAMRAQVKTGAPKPEPAARLFDPKKVPSMGVSYWAVPPSPPPKPLTEAERIEREFERLRKAFSEFMHGPDPQKHPTQRLLGLYAALAGKTAMPSKDFGDLPIHFHVDTPLTKSELLYAIETTFTLNNLAIIPVDDRTIRLGPIAEVLRNNGGRLGRVPPKQ